MNGHTPGPWDIQPATLGFRTPCADDAKDQMIVAGLMCVGVIWDGVFEKVKAEQEANARLIAAAPDLLAICEKILDEDDKDSFVDRELWEELQATVAKAKGAA